MAYTVVRGDTLNAIARNLGITLEELLELNPDITNPDRINVGQEINTPPGDEEATDPEGEDGDTVDSDGVMAGGDLVRVERADGTSYFALRYLVGGVEHLYSFASEEAALQALGNLDGATAMLEDDVNDGDTWLLGDAEGFVGQDGNYQTYFSSIMNEAALEGGVRNPGMLGQFLADPEVQRIMAMAEAGDWGEVRIRAEVRNTDFYLNTLYPGIESFLNTGLQDPEQAWSNYTTTVEGTLSAMGYTRDADGSYRSLIGEMLTAGVEADTFVDMGATFIRAEQSPEFMEDLAAWYQQDTGQALQFEDWFDVLAGSSSTELDAIVEKAQLQFQADQTSLGLDPQQIRRLARETQLSESAIAAGFTSAERNLLAIGNQNLARFGLTEADLVSASFGLAGSEGGVGAGGDVLPPPSKQSGPSGVAPALDPKDLPPQLPDGRDPFIALEPDFKDDDDGGEGGLSAEEIRRRARKAILELGLADDPKAQFFTGFTRGGRPVKTGLLAGAPEAG